MAYGRVNVEGVNLSEIEKIQQSLESINGLIGKANDTSGTATAGTVIAKLNKLLTDWTATRAGYLTNLNTRLTSTRAGYLDKLANFGEIEDTEGSATTGTVMAKLNKLLTDWTTTRAGYISTINTNAARLTSARATKIDNIGATGDTGGTATAGTLMAKVNALLSAGGSAGLKVKSVQHGYVESASNKTTGTELDTNNYRKIKISTVNASKAVLLSFNEITSTTPSSQSRFSALNRVPVLYNTYLLQPFYAQYGSIGNYIYNYTGFSYYVIEFQ